MQKQQPTVRGYHTNYRSTSIIIPNQSFDLIISSEHNIFVKTGSMRESSIAPMKEARVKKFFYVLCSHLDQHHLKPSKPNF